MRDVFFTLLITAAVLTLPPIARGDIIYSDFDTMSIEDVSGVPGETIEMTISMANPSFSIAGVSHRIGYDETLLDIDTVVCIERGCNLETIHLNFSEPGVIWIAAVSAQSSLIPIDTGPVFIVSFVIEESAPATRTGVEFENQFFYNNAWADSTGLDLIIPILKNGSININSQTDIDEDPTLPDGFAILQNYPNPFNNHTVISFNLPFSENVELAVFDLLGREVTNLYSGRADAGRTDINWDGRSSVGKNLPSGVYFYRLSTAGGKTITRRMTLLK